MSTAIAPTDGGKLLERVVIEGDLAILKPEERVAYYRRVCETLGLNPLTKPFDYIRLNNKLTLYAKRDATDQLRKLHGISVVIASRDQVGDLYVVTARATDRNNRTDESIGAVSTVGLKGEALANAMMKSETKSKRRVTLSIAGLGWLDESEAQSVPDAALVPIDTETGEIRESRKDAIRRLNKAFVGAGLSKDDLKHKARQMFGREEITSVEDLADAEIGFLADEVEQLVASTKGA